MLTGSISLLILSSCVGFLQTPQLAKHSGASSISIQEAALLNEQQHEEALTLRSQLPSFGFDNISANANFISFLLYFGDDELRDKSGYGLSPYFFESITPKDPYYRDFYVFLTNSVSVTAGQPRKSVDLINQGLALLNKHRTDDSFYVWRYKGVDELLFLGDSKAAEQSFETAAEWARESNLPESDSMASLSQQTADFLKQNPNSKAAQIGAWGSILSTAVDDEARNRAIENIQKLGGEVVVNENGSVTIKYAWVDVDSES